MYAIIESGGKQYRVTEGEEVCVDLMIDAEGDLIFDKVMLVSDGTTPKVGLPYLPKCSVHATVLGTTKGPKVVAFKYKKCKNYRRTVGHRQKYTRVKINKIVAA